MDFFPFTLLITRTVSCTSRLATEMSTCTTSAARPIAEYPCKGCRTIQRFSSFLTYVDPGCYRVHVQCLLCLQKSTDNYRKHREDIKMARLAREQVHEHVACVCGVTINVRYREKHCRSKRHQAVVALLNNAMLNAPAGGAPAAAVANPSSANRAPIVTNGEQHQMAPAVPSAVRSRHRPSMKRLDQSSTSSAEIQTCTPDNASATISAASAPARAERNDQPLQEEIGESLVAVEQRLAAQQALHERRRSLSRALEPSTLHVETTRVTVPPLDPFVVTDTDSAATPKDRARTVE